MRLKVLVACAMAWLFAGVVGGCGERDDRPTVVLYSSVDRYVLVEAVAAFEAEHGVRVELVTDTEVTKTFGLVNRLLAERDAPRADVWWSSEPYGTVRLAEAGVLAPVRLERAEAAFEGGWPAGLKQAWGGEGVGVGGAPGVDEHYAWYGFAQRARVIAYDAGSLEEGAVPRTLAGLADAAWSGRVGMARPEFGTTRGHVGALYLAWGEEFYRLWLRAMRNNGLRLYDGNATVVRAIESGEIDLGLTDTDDVWAAQRNGAAVGFVYEAVEADAVPPSFGPLVLPNTAGLELGGPDSASDVEGAGDAAVRLLEWLVSPANERLLAESDSRNIPVSPELNPPATDAFAELAVPGPWRVNLAGVAAAMQRAVEIAVEELE